MSSRLRALAPAAAIVLTSTLAVSSSGLISAARKGVAGPRGAEQIEAGRLESPFGEIHLDKLCDGIEPTRGRVTALHRVGRDKVKVIAHLLRGHALDGLSLVRTYL